MRRSVKVSSSPAEAVVAQAGLAGVLKESAGIPCERFSEFMAGFGAASELFTWVDVGDRKEAADEKIKGSSA